MKNSDSDPFDQHIDELRLAYSENLLSPAERSKFEEHLNKCPDCVKKMADWTNWIDIVKTNKHALCPEGWELFDYVGGAEDASAILASHVDHCESCRDTVEAFRKPARKEGVPDALWDKMTRLHAQSFTEPKSVVGTWIGALLDQISDFFRLRLVLAGAVAAAILVAVIMYPTGTSGPLLGLSTVSWGPSHSINLMGPPNVLVPKAGAKKDRLAIIIYFVNFKSKPEGKRIDSFYRLLAPGKDVLLRYDVVSPSEVKAAFESSGLKGGGKDEVLRVVRDKLSVSQALIMELSQKGDRFSIRAELMNAVSGNVIRERGITDISEADLPEQAEAASESVMKSK